MRVTTLPVDVAGSAEPCEHTRQHHPGAPGRMLPCAWPGCERGVGEDRLSIGRADRAFPLLVERRSMLFLGTEQHWFWHPCPGQE